MEELKASLKKSGLFTVIVNGIMLLLSVLVMIMGFVIWHNVIQKADDAEGAAAIGMIFVIIIMVALIIIIEGVSIIFFIMNAVAFSFGMYLLLSKNFDIDKIKRKRRLLITICVLMYIMSIALFIAGIVMFTSADAGMLGILCLVASIAIFVVAFLQIKNVKRIKYAINNLDTKEA